MLTKEFKAAHPQVPWKQIEGMRHVLVHDYYKISPIQVFKVANQDIPQLLPLIKALQKPL